MYNDYNLSKLSDINDNCLNILFAGNIGIAQDFPNIIKAANELKKLKYKIQWIIIGEGRMLRWCRNEVKRLKLENEFLIGENKKLRELLDESINSQEIFARVLIDKDSPYLKSVVLNKGTKDKVKIGMAVIDDVYLVGQIIEVNYTNSRALLLSDLNSKIPSVLEPDDIQAVISGTGSDFGKIEHTQEEFREDFKNKEIFAYTSGLGGLFKPGIPIGKINNISEGKINFFSDFTQLNYVKIVSYKIGGEE